MLIGSMHTYTVSRFLRCLSVGLLCFSVLPQLAAGQCEFPQQPLRAFEASEAVFVGVVLDVSDVSAVGWNGRPTVAITVRMLQSWKGPIADTLTMLGWETTNDYQFEVGRTYLVYARYVRPELEYLHSSSCTPTRPIQEAEDRILALGRPHWPEHCIAVRIVRGERVCERR
jgi:hypothetical protein